MSEAARFAKYCRPAPSGCVEWTGASNAEGRGWFAFRGRPHLAPRVAWTLAHGRIPRGKCVLHRCDNPRCVRIEHLFLGSQRENIADMVAKGRHVAPPKGEAHNKAVLSEDDVRRMRAMRTRGRTYVAIATEFGVVRSAASAACRGTTWKGVSGACPKPAPKLTKRIVLALRKAHSAGASCRSLRLKFGLGQATVWNACHGVSWPELPGACTVKHR